MGRTLSGDPKFKLTERDNGDFSFRHKFGFLAYTTEIVSIGGHIF